MIISCAKIVDTVTESFCDANRYKQFAEFQWRPEYRPYWDKCIEAIRDPELLSHIIFCNDLFHIPPVKTFLLYFREDIAAITGREDALLPTFIKKSIGAFWGMVFKFVLGYQNQENVSISLNRYFMVRTATYFFDPIEKIELVPGLVHNEMKERPVLKEEWEYLSQRQRGGLDHGNV